MTPEQWDKASVAHHEKAAPIELSTCAAVAAPSPLCGGTLTQDGLDFP